MNSFEWKDNENDTLYYYKIENGKIVGQVHKIAHTKVWLAKIFTKIHTEEIFLGQYITNEFAKKAIENFILIDERTLIE